MEKYEALLIQLNTDLDVLESETENILSKAERGIGITKKSLRNLRQDVLNNGFKSSKEEIYFFKQIKPKIYSKLIYYVKLFCIENRRPKSSTKNQIKFLNNEINKFQEYFNFNLDFCIYYRRNSTVFDEQYFLRGKEDIRLFPDTYHFYTDEQFSTSHDTSVVTILAYDLLIAYLKREIDRLEGYSNYYTSQFQQKPSKITWTSQKVNLIELIYALHSTDVINNGTADIKDIARIVEKIFKIDLGDCYRAFLEIRMRKKGRTKFLDNLKESLEKRMDEIDN